ncbi:muscle M-line assembly protein unc-89-like isoform X2 [Amphibalanus amphitrite]|uniref:muscle M-line assembly protein unc-89-like isoform X2 n=1 Tax=Amphibalanus amphitrite TaxID=1232801 RepID=UPI001C92B0B4|nr:muscle M-line assembly protein unc-89-like isoform X2 [Amphibalanus amphitrite]
MGRGTMADGAEALEARGPGSAQEATTLSTIAVQSGTTRIVIALLQNKEWVELKCLEMTPELSHLAPSLEEAQQLQQQHEEVLQKLASKESPVEELLNQADQLIARQDTKASTYSAMAESLAMAWRELNAQLEQRRQVLAQCVRFHRRSRNFSDVMDLADGVFGDVSIPTEPAEAEEAIRRLLDVRKGVLEGSMLTLQEGNLLLEKLRLLATRGTVDSRPNQIRTALQTSCVQVERWMESLHDRRRLVDVLFTNRRHILEQCLALAGFHADLDEVERRAEQSRRQLLSACELGDSASSAEILLYEHAKMEAQAKSIQDRGLHLLRAAEGLVQSGTFARDQPRTRAYTVLERCSQLVGAAERRAGLLTAAAEFFRLAQQASDRLLQLEADLQAAPAADQGATLGRISRALRETAEPALIRGEQILSEAGHGQPGTEGVTRCLDDLRRRLATLTTRCQSIQQSQQRHKQSHADFFDKYSLLYGWLSNTADSFLRSHYELGTSLGQVNQFVTVHEQMQRDVMSKGEEIDSLLFGVADVVRHMDRGQARELEEKTADLRSQWTALQQVIDSRLDLSRVYQRFHQQTEPLRNSVAQLNSTLSGGSLSDEQLRKLEDQWMNMQQQYHQLAAVGQRFIDRSYQVRDPYLDVAAARSCVEAIVEQLRAGHLTITENYERVQLTTTTIKRVQRQWERVQRDARKVEESVTYLESQLYPILRETGLSLDQRQRQCEDRMDRVLPLLRQAQADVQQMEQTAQKVCEKGAGETSRSAERLSRELNTRKNHLTKCVTDYQNLLQMIVSYLRKLKDVESSVQKRKHLDSSRPLPKETEECQQALKDLETTQNAFNELFRLAGEELECVAERLRQVEPPSAADHDISQLREALDKESNSAREATSSKTNTDTPSTEQRRRVAAGTHVLVYYFPRQKPRSRPVLDRDQTKWESAQTTRKELLERQVTSAVFDAELSTINSQLTDLSDQLARARGHYGESLHEATQTKQAFNTFEETIEGTGRQIENFVSTAHEYLGGPTGEREQALSQLEALQDRWTAFQRQVAENKHLTDLAIQYFTLLEEAEDWYKSGGRLLVDVARQVSCVRRPEEAHQLRTDIGQFLTPGAQQQAERLETAGGLAHQLYGASPPRRLASVTQDSQEMVESFEAIRTHLTTLGGSLEQLQREHDSLRREKDELSAEREAAKQEAEVARSATAAADEARRAAEVAARALEDMPRPMTPLVVPKVDVCTETVTEITKVTVDRSTQEEPRSTSDASTQESAPWEEQVIRASPPSGQQVSPPKRPKRDEPPPAPPTFTEPLRDHTVQDGVRHTLQARVSGVPAPKVNWQKDGVSCDSNPDYVIAHEHGLCTLTIEETMVDDTGTFTCRAWNSAGVTQSSCRLTVRDAASEEELAPPIFTRQLTDCRVREGRPLLLAATVTGNPLPVVTWLRDGTCVDASPDYVITYNNGGCELRIEEALPQDGGQFVCRASNMLGADQTSAMVKVEPRTPSEAPRFTTPLSNVMARTGQKLRLECAVRALPHPELTWLHNNKPVRDNVDAKLTFDGRRATLTIAEPFPKDAGTYTIVANNAAGQATCSCNVSVKGRLPTETSDSEMASDLEPVKPSIPVQLKNMTVPAGRQAQLDCVITGQPEPEVIWYHNDQPVKESKNSQLLFHGDRCTLVINSVRPEDAGTYTVVAINSAGEATSEARLDVAPEDADEEPPVKPKFVRSFSNINATEGQPLVLEAEVADESEPLVIWLKDGSELKPSESVKITRTGGVCRLEIASLLPQHAGTYLCLASNAAGEARCLSRVVVKPGEPKQKQKRREESQPRQEMQHEIHQETYQETRQEKQQETEPQQQQKQQTPGRRGSLRRRLPPSFVQIFVDQEAEPGDEVLFECIINGWPKPTVEWLLDDGPLPAGFNTSSDGQLHVLRIACGDHVPCGQIKCVAENDIGKATCAAHLSGADFSNGSTGRKSRKSTKKTTYVETREETEVINGDQRRGSSAEQRYSEEETHSGVAEGRKKQVLRSSHERSKEARRHRMEDSAEEDGERPVQPPRFTTPLQGTVVHEGESVKLTGQYSGRPKITWFKDGVELDADSSAVTSFDDSHVTLTIESAGEQDEGKYTCQLKNAAGTSKSTAELLVRKIIEPPTFDQRLEAQVVLPGQKAVLEVKVSGLPPPKVTWTRDGRPISDGENGVVISQNENHHTLTIENVTHDHAGKYGCSAKNDGGESTSIADFLVTDVMPDVIERRVISHDVTDGEVVEKSGRWTDQEIVEKSVSSHKWERSTPGVRRPAAPPADSDDRPTEPSVSRRGSQGARPAGDGPRQPPYRARSPPPRPARRSDSRERDGDSPSASALVRPTRRADDSATTTRYESFGELSTREVSTHHDTSTRKDSSMRREVSMRQESSTTRVHQEISHQVVSQSQQVRREFRLSDLPDPGGPRRGQRALPASGRQYSPSPEPESIPKRRETPEPSERHYKAQLVVKLSDERTSPPSESPAKKSSRASQDRERFTRSSEDRDRPSPGSNDREKTPLNFNDRDSFPRTQKNSRLFSRASEDRETSHYVSKDSGLSSHRVSEDRSSSLRRSEERSVEERSEVTRTQTVRSSGRGAAPGRPDRTAHSQSRSPSPPALLKEDHPQRGGKTAGSHFRTERITTASRSYGPVDSPPARDRPQGEKERASSVNSAGHRSHSPSDDERGPVDSGGRWTAEAVESALQRSRLNGRAKQANGRHSAPAEKAPKENADSALLRAPVLLRPLADHTVRPGAVTQLRLIVDALPPPSVTWYKDGRQLEPRPDAPYAISEDGGVCTLSLPRAHPDDSGVYCCVATNHLGSVCSEALLAVAGEL